MPKFTSSQVAAANNATEVLIERFLPVIWQYIRYWVKNNTVSEDLTLVILKSMSTRYKAGDEYREDFQSRLFSLVRRTLADYFLQNTEKQNKTSPQITGFLKSCPGMKVIPDRDCLEIPGDDEGLTREQREVFSLKLIAGLNSRSIASILGLSESDIETILYKALYKLNK